jgi:hypothetical protein
MIYENSAPTADRTQSASTLKTNRLLYIRETTSIRDIYVSQSGVDKVASLLRYYVVSDVSDDFAASVFGV